MAFTPTEEAKIRAIIESFDNGKTIPEILAATSVLTTDQLEVVQDAVSKKATFAQILTLVNSQIPSEIYVGSTTPTSPSIKLWIDTTEVVVNNDVEILRAIRDANPQSTALATLFDDSKDPLTEWWDEENYLGALFGGHPNFETLYQDYEGTPLPINVDISRCYILSLVGIEITSLNATGLSSLIELNCDENTLTSLEVSGLISLINLSCSSNQISSLNLSGLSNLKGAICYNSQFDFIDLTGTSSLEMLLIGDNRLTSIPSLVSKGLISNYNFSYNYLPTEEISRLEALGFTMTEWTLPQNTPIE